MTEEGLNSLSSKWEAKYLHHKKKSYHYDSRCKMVLSILAKCEAGLEIGTKVRLRIWEEDAYSVGNWVVAGYYQGRIGFCRPENFAEIRKDGIDRFNNAIVWKNPFEKSHWKVVGKNAKKK